MEFFQHLSTKLSSTHNFKHLRDTQENTEPPAIPYLGVFLQDLTFLEDGNPDLIDDGKINFSKRQHVARVIFDLLRFQGVPYNFQSIPELRIAIENLEFDLDDHTLFKKSLMNEPREKSP